MTASQGRANRLRGARAEVAVVNYLRTRDYGDARRYLAGDGRQPGDIDAIPGVCIEVKDRAASSWPTWMSQAVAEAGPHLVAVVVRRTRGQRDVGEWPCRWVNPGGLAATPNRATFADFLNRLEN